MPIGWNGETVPDLPLEQEIELAASSGYDCIELFVPKVVDYLHHHSSAELKRRLDTLQLAPLSLNGIENINLCFGSAFEDVQTQCRWAAEVASTIGCPYIVVVPSPKPAEANWSTIRAQTTQALIELATIAAAYGVKLGLEFLAPSMCSVRTLSEAWEIVQSTHRAEIGIVLDTYHFCVGGSDWAALDSVDINRIWLIHINDVEDLPFAQLSDYDRLLPGEGVLPLPLLLKRLYQNGYRGAYSLEVMRPAYRRREPAEYMRAGYTAIAASLGSA